MKLLKNMFSIFLKGRKKQSKKIDSPSAPVLLPIKNSPGRFVFFCPGCQTSHIINTNSRNGLPVHSLYGSPDKPTIKASVLSRGDKKMGKPHCHSFITRGRIKFLKDCTHKLAGKTVNLEAL
jgi:Family of unknown function (DUF6527)